MTRDEAIEVLREEWHNMLLSRDVNLRAEALCTLHNAEPVGVRRKFIMDPELLDCDASPLAVVKSSAKPQAAAPPSSVLHAAHRARCGELESRTEEIERWVKETNDLVREMMGPVHNHAVDDLRAVEKRIERLEAMLSPPDPDGQNLRRRVEELEKKSREQYEWIRGQGKKIHRDLVPRMQVLERRTEDLEVK